MRRAARRTDANQVAIVAALRKCGRPVEVLSHVGGGIPDLLTRHRNGSLIFLEVKDGDKPPSRWKLTYDEARFAVNWPGAVVVVLSVDDALRAVGIETKGNTMNAILTQLGLMIVDYVLAGDFAAVAKWAQKIVDIVDGDDEENDERTEEVKTEALRGLYAGMARDRASAATTLSARQKRPDPTPGKP